MESLSFPKIERLSGRDEISKVFEAGESSFSYPFKIYFTKNSNQEHSRILVSVPARNFKKAVDRNLLKRRIKEAYRLNSFRKQHKIYNLACLYIAKEIVNYSLIEKKLNQVLKSIVQKD